MASKVIRETILTGELGEPILFRKIHENWIPLSWSLDEWGKMLEGTPRQPLRVRCGRKQGKCEGTQWESDCKNLNVSWKTLAEWDMLGTALNLGKINNSEFWMYYDYKYMMEILGPDSDYIKKFEWSKLGFPDRDGRVSTLWIGTQGSYTPCHFDTYGCNLVTQIVGRKKWILFPPEDTKFLRPTRVPYEESSVYTQINISAPTVVEKEKYLTKCRPLEVTLEPGDVLYVPPQWWHFVNSLDFTISANTWVELPADCNIRLEEAIIRSVVSCVINSVSPDSVSELLNPNEAELLDMTEADILELLKSSSEEVLTATTSNQKWSRDLASTEEETLGSMEATRKSSAFEKLQNIHSCAQKLKSTTFDVDSIENKIHVKPKDIQVLPLKSVDENDGVPDRIEHRSSCLQHLINAIGHPDILKQISAQFLQNITQDSS